MFIFQKTANRLIEWLYELIFSATVWALWVRFYSYFAILKTGITDVHNFNSVVQVWCNNNKSVWWCFIWQTCKPCVSSCLTLLELPGEESGYLCKQTQEMAVDLMTCRCVLTCPCVNSGRSLVHLEVHGCRFLLTEADKVQSPVLHSSDGSENELVFHHFGPCGLSVAVCVFSGRPRHQGSQRRPRRARSLGL